MQRPALAFLRRRNAERHPGRHNPPLADACLSRRLRSSRNETTASLQISAIGDVSCATSPLSFRGTIRRDCKTTMPSGQNAGYRREPDGPPSSLAMLLDKPVVFPGSAKIIATRSPIILDAVERLFITRHQMLRIGRR